MKLEDLQALANGSGLVPMKVKRAFAPWNKGDVAGFPPNIALAHLTSGDAELVGANAPGNFNPVSPLDHDGNGRKGGAKPAKARATADDKKIEIPKDWEKLPPLKIIKLATDLGWNKPKATAMPAGSKVSDLAGDFIRSVYPATPAEDPAAGKEGGQKGSPDAGDTTKD